MWRRLGKNTGLCHIYAPFPRFFHDKAGRQPRIDRDSATVLPKFKRIMAKRHTHSGKFRRIQNSQGRFTDVVPPIRPPVTLRDRASHAGFAVQTPPGISVSSHGMRRPCARTARPGFDQVLPAQPRNQIAVDVLAKDVAQPAAGQRLVTGDGPQYRDLKFIQVHQLRTHIHCRPNGIAKLRPAAKHPPSAIATNS